MSVCNVHTSLWGNCHVKYILKFSLHTQPAQPTLSWHCKTLLPSFYPIGRLRVMCGWACASTLGANKKKLLHCTYITLHYITLLHHSAPM